MQENSSTDPTEDDHILTRLTPIQKKLKMKKHPVKRKCTRNNTQNKSPSNKRNQKQRIRRKKILPMVSEETTTQDNLILKIPIQRNERMKRRREKKSWAATIPQRSRRWKRWQRRSCRAGPGGWAWAWHPRWPWRWNGEPELRRYEREQPTAERNGACESAEPELKGRKKESLKPELKGRRIRRTRSLESLGSSRLCFGPRTVGGWAFLLTRRIGHFTRGHFTGSTGLPVNPSLGLKGHFSTFIWIFNCKKRIRSNSYKSYHNFR